MTDQVAPTHPAVQSLARRASAPSDIDEIPLLDAALELAVQGWAILPCHPGGDRAKAPIGTLVPHGVHQATSDAATLRRWWAARPDALIGAAVPDSVLILDVDPRNSGSVEALEAVVGRLPATLVVVSGRGDGGRHFYFRRPPGRVSSARLPAGVDLKVSGYMIMPPSPHPATGRVYRWVPGTIAMVPPRMLAALRPPVAVPTAQVVRRPAACASARVAGMVRAIAQAPEGGRHHMLHGCARRLVEDGLDPALLHLLRDAAVAAGLPLGEAEAVIDWCLARTVRGGAE